MARCRVRIPKKYREDKAVDVSVEYARVPCSGEAVTIPNEVSVAGYTQACVKDVIHVWNSEELGYAAELHCLV